MGGGDDADLNGIAANGGQVRGQNIGGERAATLSLPPNPARPGAG